jgi:phospholipid/cholesterol/gamma-HCH transport system substrate-binding protein
MAKIDNVVPSLADGKADELFLQLKSIREMAENLNKRSGVLMQEGRRSLIDISLAAQKVTRKFDSQTGAAAPAPSPPRKPNQKRQ